MNILAKNHDIFLFLTVIYFCFRYLKYSAIVRIITILTFRHTDTFFFLHFLCRFLEKDRSKFSLERKIKICTLPYLFQNTEFYPFLHLKYEWADLSMDILYYKKKKKLLTEDYFQIRSYSHIYLIHCLRLIMQNWKSWL